MIPSTSPVVSQGPLSYRSFLRTILGALAFTATTLTAHTQSATPPPFPSPTVYTTGSTSSDVLVPVTADFNGDGIPDLATANLSDSSFNILLGKGDGTFQPSDRYPVPNYAIGLVSGDFNQDGKQDIAVLSYGNSQLQIFLNAGNGTFPATASNTYTTGSGPYTLAATDLNKDGHIDLIVVNANSKTLSLFLGAGDGSFTATSTAAIGNTALSIAVGDLNNDTYPDVVVANYADNTISVLLNDKNGGLSSQITYPTGKFPYSVAVGDFNGDGRPDVAVANLGNNTLGVLLNDGTGALTAQITYPTGKSPTSVLAKDTNGDNILDLVTSNFNDSTLSVLLGKGDGTFTAQTTVNVPSAPWNVVSADFNGDGLADLATSSAVENTVAVSLQTKQPMTDVTTYHFNNARTGLNPSETILSPANVTSSSFGKKALLTADGKVDAEPLYLANLNINGQTHNVVYVASEHGSVYAFDADTYTQLWQVSTLLTGETTSDDHSCGQITPEIGITSTPVIDRAAGPNGTIFVVAMSKNASGVYHQRLHALDITNGHELSGSPSEITGTYPGTGDGSDGKGNVIFDPHQYAERAGLLLSNNTIYLGWTSHCDQRPYGGWVMGYNENTLQQTSVLNLTPNGNEGAIWMSGAGMAADYTGNIYLLDANGETETTFDANGFPSKQDYGNAILKLSTTGSKLAVADFFEPYNTVAESNADVDLGSGGLLLIDQLDPNGKIQQLLVGAGKDNHIYVANRNNLGKFNAANNSNLYQDLPNALPGGAWSMPAFFNNTVYYGSVGDYLRAFPLTSAKLATTASSISPTKFGYPGATPSISSNGAANGIVWALESGTGSAGVLHAYDATNLAHELYNSKQATGGRDSFGNGNKFITPVIINGKVLVPTPTGVAVFGLLN